MADTIIDSTQFNVEDIRYSPIKANASGGKALSILNPKTKSGLRLSTPLMLTWGASDYEGNQKFEMSLQFPSEDYKTDDATAFLENMKAFEEKIKNDALTHSKEWFGKVHKTADVVDALFTPMLKYPKDKETGEPDKNRDPLLRVKIPMWDGVWKTLICDEDGKKLFPSHDNPMVSPLDFLSKGTNLAIIMQCGGIWFANGKFGVTWKLVQAVVQKPKASLLDECLIKLKPSDKEKLKSLAPVEPEDRSGNEIPTHVEDSDEEEEHDEVEEEEEEDIPIPAPVIEEKPVIKKKVVRKKTVV